MSRGLLIPGVGRFVVSYDRLRLVSTTRPNTLRLALKDAGFENWVHHFKVGELERLSRSYRSKLEFTPVGTAALGWLEKNEALLGNYNFTMVEVACDCLATMLTMLRRRMTRLIKTTAKPRAIRGHIVATRQGARLRHENPDPSRPTFYVEGRRSTVGLKFYERFGKTTDGRLTGDMLTRVELTFKRSQTIRNKFGGSRVTDLLRADLPNVVRKQLRLERVDYAEVGKLVAVKANRAKRRRIRTGRMPVPRGYASEDEYLATRRAVTMLRWYAQKNRLRLNGWKNALLVSLHSPIEIRGILKKLQRRNPAITDYKIDRCFVRDPWRKRVRL